MGELVLLAANRMSKVGGGKVNKCSKAISEKRKKTKCEHVNNAGFIFLQLFGSANVLRGRNLTCLLGLKDTDNVFW